MTSNTSPIVSAFFGLGILGVVIFQLYTGIGFGRLRRFRREENPGYYWFLIACELVFSGVWLSKVVPS